MQLRHYQLTAVDQTYEWLRSNDGNPVIVIPTGGGKTPIIATFCRDAVRNWGCRVLVISHVKELLDQTRSTLLRMADLRHEEIGIYSAGLGERSTDEPIILAGIQSVYDKMSLFGPRDLILIDECHLVPVDGEGMYRRALEHARHINPHVRVIGLSATPFRMRTGYIYGDDQIFADVSYEIGIKPLIAEGFLCPLKSKGGLTEFDLSGVHVRGGEYVESEMQAAFAADAQLTMQAVSELCRVAEGRQSVLVFTAGVEHAKQVAGAIQCCTEDNVKIITGETSASDRDAAISEFKSGALRWLVNVNVLTTGFDAPNVDCVVLLRATKSPGLFYQMVGRGFRLHPLKQDCLVLDFGGNILRHGPVDELTVRKAVEGQGQEPPAKQCPMCQAVCLAAARTCTECGHVFPEPERKPTIEPQAETRGILSGQSTKTRRNVLDWWATVHRKRNAPEGAPTTLRVTYAIGISEDVSEYLCFDHTGFARTKAVQWWVKHSGGLPIPASVNDAWSAFRDIGCPASITIKETAGNKFPDIVEWHSDAVEEPVPNELEAAEVAWNAFDVPF